MCTVVAKVSLSGRWPLLIGAIRDEAVDRRWSPPALHWSNRFPNVLGGYDREAGGTWLAIDIASHSISFIINREERTQSANRRSRGELPPVILLHQGEWALDDAALRHFDGFLAGYGSKKGLCVWEWDTLTLRSYDLADGLHLLCYRGINVEDHPRLAYFRQRFACVEQPNPLPGSVPLSSWGGWLQLLAGDGLSVTDPKAIRWQRIINGSLWASQSASCVAVNAYGVRYDFTATPENLGSWMTVYDSGVASSIH